MSFIDGQRPLYEIKANLFKGLAHPFRIRILELLSDAHSPVAPAHLGIELAHSEVEPPAELSVADLLRDTELEASHLSQHLSVLRRHRLVESERRGSHVYYRLAHPRVAHMLTVARSLLLDTLASDEKLLADASALPAFHEANK